MDDEMHPALSEQREPPITIRMDGDQVVIRPDARLDSDSTEAFAAVLNAAVAAGSVVLVDLDGQSLDPAITRGMDVIDGADGVDGIDGDGHWASRTPAPAVAAGPGVVQLASTSSCWTVDLRARRLFRSQEPVDRWFVPADAWTGLRRLWVSTTTLTALTSPGMFVSARRFGPGDATTIAAN